MIQRQSEGPSEKHNGELNTPPSTISFQLPLPPRKMKTKMNKITILPIRILFLQHIPNLIVFWPSFFKAGLFFSLTLGELRLFIYFFDRPYKKGITTACSMWSHDLMLSVTIMSHRANRSYSYYTEFIYKKIKLNLKILYN